MQSLGFGRASRAGYVACGCALLLAVSASGASAQQSGFSGLFGPGSSLSPGETTVEDTRPFSITPMAGLQETFTDNALLTSNNKEADLVTRPMVGAQIDARGPLTANLTAHAFYDAYLNQSQLSGFSGDAQGIAKYELVPSFLSIDADAFLTNSSISTFGTPALNRVGPSNQVTIATYDIGPHVTTTVDDFADLDVVGRFAQVFFLNPQGSTVAVPTDSSFVQGSANLDTGKRYLGYESVTSAQVQSDDHDFQAYNFQQSFFVEIFPSIRLIARGGYDSVTQPGIVDIKEAMWSGGAEWTINEDSRVSVERGERFGRPAWTGDVHLRFSEGLYADGRYFEAVQPGQLQLNNAFVNFISPTQQLPTQLTNGSFAINGNIDDQTALTKTANLHLVYQWDGNAIDLEGGYNDRLLLALNSHDRSLVTGLNYSREIAPDLSASAGVNYYRTFSNPFFGENDGIGGNVAVQYNFNRTLRGVLGYSYQNQQETISNTSITENVVFAAVAKQF
ncbi:MAG TPA: TIGR03016 family PEP-CTERM system-associated outer membrane protein [Rhizomicrobium sp.]|jgi:uncharacterized protein (PEP-CTERM system associated)